MSDYKLSKFGVRVSGESEDDPDPEPEPDDSPSPSYRNGRCPAISVGSRQRCRSPTSRMRDAEPFCGTHGRELNPWSIHDDPEKLILVTGELDALSLDDLDQEDVDFDLDRIREAVAAVTGGEA